MLHGGIIATLMDDVIGTLMTVNQNPSAVTAYMNVRYLMPVVTPQTVLVVAKSRGSIGEARKVFVDAEVRDSVGVVLAKAEALWVRFKERL